jgi:hypothetical protein
MNSLHVYHVPVENSSHGMKAIAIDRFVEVSDSVSVPLPPFPSWLNYYSYLGPGS